MNISVTILTQPVPARYRLILSRLRGVLCSTASSGEGLRYGGHHAVTRSLVEGMKRIGATFSYNPQRLKDVHRNVVVLSDVKALEQAIGWKRCKRIDTLLAGPNLMLNPDMHDGILSDPEVDRCIVPSQPVLLNYQLINPLLWGRIVPWAAGVDDRFWVPKQTDRSKKDKVALVYCKKTGKQLEQPVVRLLAGHGWQPVVVRYGEYDLFQFRDRLAEAAFAVFLSPSESQGIALAESWCMDVPTLVWSPVMYPEHDLPNLLPLSAAPYLGTENGVSWHDLGELDDLLARMPFLLEGCKPREWVLRHMTDQVSAEHLLAIFREVIETAHGD